MQVQIVELFRSLAALVAGGLIGSAFGAVQEIALKRNEQRQQTGDLKNGWSVMPGSMRRVAYLLIGLVLVQILCPLFFENGSQWWVSAGVVLAYAWFLFRGLARRRAGSP